MKKLVAAVVVVAVAAVGLPAVAGAGGFSDVPEDHPYWEAVTAAVAEGWVLGFPDGSFRPDVVLTEKQRRVIAERAGDDGVLLSATAAAVTRGEFVARITGKPPLVIEPPPDAPVVVAVLRVTAESVLAPELSAEHFAGVDCEFWVRPDGHVGLVERLRQMVYFAAESGWEWPRALDKDGDGYPCEVWLGTGYLPPPPPPPPIPPRLTITETEGTLIMNDFSPMFQVTWFEDEDRLRVDKSKTGEMVGVAVDYFSEGTKGVDCGEGRVVEVEVVEGVAVGEMPAHRFAVCRPRWVGVAGGVFCRFERGGTARYYDHWECQDTRTRWDVRDRG